jgi:hypothetical protein
VDHVGRIVYDAGPLVLPAMLMRPNDEFYVFHRLAPEQIQIFIFAFRHPLNVISCCCYALTVIVIYIAFDLLNLSLILLQFHC